VKLRISTVGPFVKGNFPVDAGQNPDNIDGIQVMIMLLQLITQSLNEPRAVTAAERIVSYNSDQSIVGGQS